MLYIIKDSVYVRVAEGFNKCVMHKKQVNGDPVYYLVATKAHLDSLPSDYAVVTMQEAIARYGHMAVDDDESTREA